MHHLDTDKLYRDIRVKLNKVDKSQDYLAAKIKTSRRTIWKVGKGYVIALDTFFKLCHWLDEEPSKYIVKLTKKEYAEKKQLQENKKNKVHLKYYDKEKHREYMKEHRDHKKELYNQKLIGNEKNQNQS